MVVGYSNHDDRDKMSNSFDVKSPYFRERVQVSSRHPMTVSYLLLSPPFLTRYKGMFPVDPDRFDRHLPGLSRFYRLKSSGPTEGQIPFSVRGSWSIEKDKRESIRL